MTRSGWDGPAYSSASRGQDQTRSLTRPQEAGQQWELLSDRAPGTPEPGEGGAVSHRPHPSLGERCSQRAVTPPCWPGRASHSVQARGRAGPVVTACCLSQSRTFLDLCVHLCIAGVTGAPARILPGPPRRPAPAPHLAWSRPGRCWHSASDNPQVPSPLSLGAPAEARGAPSTFPPGSSKGTESLPSKQFSADRHGVGGGRGGHPVSGHPGGVRQGPRWVGLSPLPAVTRAPASLALRPSSHSSDPHGAALPRGSPCDSRSRRSPPAPRHGPEPPSTAGQGQVRALKCRAGG